MFHPEFSKYVVADHLELLRRDARHVRGMTRRPVADTREIELRLCRDADDPQLERLAALEERALPHGSFVVAAICGRIVAAMPISGGSPLRDPFARTENIVKLLEVRVQQLREPMPRRGLRPRLGLARNA